ncbi:MAG: serine/threonine-protein kinase [Acidobacteria bacterium]|nr:serine/threonine-protein kinase [Acidobacteriota bacterium]
MSTEHPDPEDLAEAILENSPADWDAAEHRVEPPDRGVIHELRVIAGIASLHRAVAANDPEAATLAQGDRWGHLEIVESIGAGPFGEVYRVWDTVLHREVALKLLTPRRTAERDTTGEILAEARLLARVRHPHVVTVFGAEQVEGRAGPWLEYITGHTLQHLVREQGPFGPTKASAIGVTLCQALAAVHAAGIIHRDVSARNVMRHDDGRIVLMDFGTGYTGVAGGRDAEIAGTPLYMAPEVIRGGEATPASDIYSLGVLLYYLLTGSFPVSGSTLDAVRQAHDAGARRPLRAARPDLPPLLVSAIERAIEPDPSARHADAGGFAEALLAAGAAAADAPPVRLGRSRFAAAAVLLSVAVGGLAWWTWRTTPQERERSFAHEAGVSPAEAPRPPGAAANARQVEIPDEMLPGHPSLDGQILPYADINGALRVFDLNTGEARILTANAGPGEFPGFSAASPDGHFVAYECDGPGGTELRVVSTDEGRQRREPRVLIPSGEVRTIRPFAWSPDGQHVLVLLQRGDFSSVLSLVALEDGSSRIVREFGASPPLTVSLSPDGQFVA